MDKLCPISILVTNLSRGVSSSFCRLSQPLMYCVLLAVTCPSFAGVIFPNTLCGCSGLLPVQNTLGKHAVLKTILHKTRTAQKKKKQKNWRQQKTQRILIIQQDSNVTKWPLIISHSPSCAQPSCANCSSTIFTQFAGSCRYSTNMSLWLCSVYSFSSQQRTLPRQHPPQTPLHNNQAYY